MTATKQISPQTSHRLVVLQRRHVQALAEHDALKADLKAKREQLDDITMQTFDLIRDEDPDGTLYAKGDNAD
ncbi:hypothetical protein LCGC14_0568600 [marine sediment metagenome]|uniref:Uncharacterized protein n=1 Tax=marine sediment metagenome TaxID=412755 RepID=A0A0F9RQ01_9ZZZZ|nr:hypothetical protein [Phycisphaerae bacterium]